MEEIIDELEDGELSDVEYTPLPRPTSALSKLGESSLVSVGLPIARPTTATRPTSVAAYNSDSDEQDSSDTDDSDGPKKPKARRMRPNLKPSRNNIPKKYCVWSQDLQEDALNEKLLHCDVDKKAAYDKSRNVESYNYLALTRFEDEEHQRAGSISPSDNGSQHRPSNKRRYKDRRNVHRRLGPRKSTSPVEDTKGPSRLIFDLKVTETDTPEDIAANIANNLYEQKETLILKTIETLGAQKAINLFIKTKDIEGDGGMMILNGARRRTPGGVFLYLLRSDGNITTQQKDLIFGEENKAYTVKKRTVRAQQRREKTRANLASLKAEDCSASALPHLLTRAELVVKQLAQDSEQTQMLVEDGGGIVEDSDEKGGEESDGTGKCEEEAVSNPPPSPATDNRENSSDGLPEMGDRKVLSYDDDFLDIGTDDMDVF